MPEDCENASRYDTKSLLLVHKSGLGHPNKAKMKVKESKFHKHRLYEVSETVFPEVKQCMLQKTHFIQVFF